MGPTSSRTTPHGLELALEVARIYHHHAIYLRDSDRYRPASLNAASKLFGRLQSFREENPKDRTVKNAWWLWRERIAMLYAANSIQVGKNRTMLNYMRGRMLLVEPENIRDIAARAAWFQSSVLSKAYQAEGMFPPSFAVVAEEIPLKPFGDDERRYIDNAFDVKLPAS